MAFFRDPALFLKDSPKNRKNRVFTSLRERGLSLINVVFGGQYEIR